MTQLGVCYESNLVVACLPETDQSKAIRSLKVKASFYNEAG